MHSSRLSSGKSYGGTGGGGGGASGGGGGEHSMTQAMHEEFKCAIHLDLLEDPRVLCKEGHCFCASCITSLPRADMKVKCPLCSEEINVDNLSTLPRPPRMILNLIELARESPPPPPQPTNPRGPTPDMRPHGTAAVPLPPLRSVLDVLQKGNWKIFHEQVGPPILF